MSKKECQIAHTLYQQGQIEGWAPEIISDKN